MSEPKLVLTRIGLSLMFLGLAVAAQAAEVVSTEYGDVVVMSFIEHLDKDNRSKCGELPKVIGYKAFQSQDNHNFTDEEYRRFADDAPFLGLRGRDLWYSRDKRKYVTWDELFPLYGAFGSGNWDHLPVLCGLLTPESRIQMASANPVFSWINGQQSCSGATCGLSGGAYLQAVYENDVDLVKRFDASIDRTFKRKLGAILPLAEDLGEKAQDFSLLPALANAYLYQFTNEYSLSCDDDVVSRVVRHRNPSYEMWDTDGLYQGRGGGEEFRFTYVLKPALMPLCDKVCDHLGGRGERFAIGTLGHSGATRTLNGIGEMVARYACSSSEIITLENNLISMTQRYLDQKYQWIPAPATAPVAAGPSSEDRAAQLEAAVAANREAGKRFLENNRMEIDV